MKKTRTNESINTEMYKTLIKIRENNKQMMSADLMQENHRSRFLDD
jgi:hypothetical protein